MLKGCHVSLVVAKNGIEEGSGNEDVVYGHVHVLKTLFDHWLKESCKLFVII